MAQRYEHSNMERKNPELRIVLVGKTGTGKSATGNTIIGRKDFVSRPSSSSVTSTCQKETGEFEGQTLAVVDTPGLFDSNMDEKIIKEEIAKGICFSAPGPHVFLIVLQLNTKEQETLKIIRMMFGDKLGAYTVALITHGDDLLDEDVTVEQLIGENEPLRNFIRQCEGGYHVFNNKDQNPVQVRELLEKISRVVQRNAGSCYTNKMFKEAEGAITVEMERLLRENPNMTVEEARRRAEKDNAFIRAVLGGGAAAAGFELGVGVGAVVGALIAGAASVAVSKKMCVIQ